MSSQFSDVSVLNSRQQTNVLLVFMLITVPMLIGLLNFHDTLINVKLDIIYVIFLSNLHFSVTLGFFLEKKSDLFYFSNLKNKIIYIVIPIFIIAAFIVIDVVSFLLNVKYEIFKILKIVNVYHLGRQSYGVLQYFKQSNKTKFNKVRNNIESYLFHSLELILVLRILEVKFIQNFLSPALVALIIILIVYLAYYNFIQKNCHFSPKVTIYFIFQFATFFISIIYPSLFIFAIAVHYYEYLTLISNRFFDKKSPLYRGGLTSPLNSKLIFYLISVNISAWLTLSFMVDKSSFSLPLIIILSLFDGLFALHFFIETYSWNKNYE